MSAQDEPVSKETQEQNTSSADVSDKENDTFEDAIDQDAIDTRSVRSLTKRQLSIQRRLADELAADQSDDEDDTPQSPAHNVNPTTEEAASEKPSPRRLSHQSLVSLDNVNLDDDSAAAPPPGKLPDNRHTVLVGQGVPDLTLDKKSTPEKGPEKEPAKPMSFSSITGSLPSMPWAPPPSDVPKNAPAGAAVLSAATATAASHPPPPVPAPVSTGRKLTSPFSWLSRSASKDQNTAPPVSSPRRNTASSVATLTSNPEMMLSKLDEEKDGEARKTSNAPRNSLVDRFRQLRLREEVVVASAMAGGDAKISEERQPGSAGHPPPSPLPPSPSRNLAPGTASGVTAGPSAIADAAVNWDLWQSVVNEGPAVVARTSAEELNKAIATGIPNAIRGVIWQVLAQSKNEELESVYRDLLSRGTDKDKDRRSNGTTISAASNGNLSTKESTSSASSVHSGESGANINGAPSPTEKDTEALQKAQALAAAERKKKDKEDMAMLQKLEKAIRRDLGARTSYSKFAAAQGLQEGLFGVCKAYALFDEGVGYAQGMNFLVMPILFNMPEEEAFCLLLRLMNQYHLRDLFIQDMPGLHLRLYQFERLLEDLEPALYCHLHRRGISPHLYATQWFLTLFAYRFPLQLVLRIYDLILSEGLSAILKFGIVLMQKNAAALLAMSDMAQLTTFLKDRLFDVYIDASPSSNSILENGFFGSSSSSIDKEVYRADQLVRDACEVKITPEMLSTYQNEWEDKTRAEKEREAELQSLKAANSNFAIKVRKLEERIEAVDHEQAALATELVRTKVDNEELKDENESLKGQVRELRLVIEQQPAEIEAAWQLERDDLMKRNGKVHEENQKLEKELSELEEELVSTKMRYAEINSQHETLQRRWTDLKRQFA
ncbi:GTPase-activating protein GYP5 [Podospora didyma]|uniref:GTPase-activating protein GYP5 n=1 Tax=Podospora didyma TaxID=330526 RepID=A0AAE0NTE4_9PEZI|nr:GTPase-activating protein GYP5 [Podospora didyma]